MAALRSEEGSPCFPCSRGKWWKPENGVPTRNCWICTRSGSARPALSGIIAVNTATYVGYKQAGFLGGVSGTLGVISPSIVIICLVASILQNFIHLPVVLHALAGIRIVVCALMLNTVVTMAKKGIVDRLGALLFVAAFLLACFTPVPTAAIVILAGIAGVVIKKIGGRKES